MIGQTVGHYQITAKIGEGGMGEVYRATDSRLQREVALKVLPEVFADNEERMGRFQREALLLASLNHPNIAAIFGLEEAEGKKALVMELVEGEDLSKRLGSGRMPLQQALRIALQIAAALESAHDRGIIHRDLKPANIKLTSDNKVKVLDFGLAKALEGEAGKAKMDLSQSPTLSLAATEAGIILGTAAYMSPEQASGLAVDKRCDIWSFGVVLFEMLSGRQLFKGETISHTLADVLRADLDWGILGDNVPRPVLQLLKRCLDRDPKTRLRDIGEARVFIEGYLARPNAEEPRESQPAPTAGSSPFRLVLPILASVIVTAVVSWVVWSSLGPDTSPVPVRLEASVTEGEALFVNQGSGLALSQDGRYLAYVTGRPEASSRRLYLRQLSQLEGAELTGTERGYNPFFAPDGQWIGFVTPTELKKVSVSGGTPLTLCKVSLSRGAAWGEQGLIVFASAPQSGLMKVSAAGGSPEEVTTLKEGEISHRWPQFLPGGTHVLFTSYAAADRNSGQIEVVDLESGVRKVVHQGGSYARYSPSGHLLYVNNRTLFASPFDLDELEMTALPAPVIESVTANLEGGAQFDVADNGTLVYLSGEAYDEVKRTLVWVGPDVPMKAASESRRNYTQGPRLSPDGRKLAVQIYSENNLDIWVHDLERDIQTRLTFHEADDQSAAWSPDGKWIAFASAREGRFQLHRKLADGSGDAERLTKGGNPQFPYSFTPDGKYLAYDEESQESNYDVWILPFEPPGEPQLFLKTSFNEADPAFSPDGKWIAYDSDESGKWEIYIRPYPGPGGKWQVSTGGGEYPIWSRDGKQVFFQSEGSIYSAPVQVEGNSIQVGRPGRLFEAEEGAVYVNRFDVSLDGKQILLSRTEEADSGLTHVKFTFHWFEELRQLLNPNQ